ncbi:MAG: alpha/beta hydrolase [Rhizobiaceae bacterium]
MVWKSSTLRSSTGAELRVYSAIPKKSPKAIIQINHGMAEHAARYERFAKALNKAGYGAYAHDHRGHGFTKADDAPLGIFATKNGMEKVVEDVAAINSHITKQHPATPIIAFGHSMGSIIAFNYIMKNPKEVAGAALWNSGVETGALSAVGKIILKVQRMFKGFDVPSKLTQKLTFEAWNKEFAPNRTDFDWLSRDNAEVDKYCADPLCGFDVSIGLWLDVLDGVYFAADNGNLKSLPTNLPIHLQAGAVDPCSEKGKGVEHIAERMNGHGMEDVTLNVIPATRHESLNEINRDETTANFIAWLDKRFG